MAALAAVIRPAVTKTPDLVYVKRWQARSKRWCPSCKVLRPISIEYWRGQYNEVVKWCGYERWYLVAKHVKSWCYEDITHADETLNQFLCPPCLAQLIGEAERTWVRAIRSDYFRSMERRRSVRLDYSMHGNVRIVAIEQRQPPKQHEWMIHYCDRPLFIGPELRFTPDLTNYWATHKGWQGLEDPQLLQELLGKDVDLRFRHIYASLQKVAM